MSVLENLRDGDWFGVRQNFRALERLFSLASASTDGKGFTVAGVTVRFGSDTVTWPGASRFSTAKTVTHGLGSIPKAVLVTSGNTNTVLAQGTVGATTFQVTGNSVDGTSPGAGASAGFYWLAIG